MSDGTKSSYGVDDRNGVSAAESANTGRNIAAFAPPSPRFALSPDGVRLVAMLAVTALLVGICIALAAPFLPAITWGIALAILAWPVHRRVAVWIPIPWVTAAITTLAIAIAIVAGGMYVTYQIARETGSAAGNLPAETIEESIRTTLEVTPLTKKAVDWMDRVGLDVETQVRAVIDAATVDLRGLARGSVSAVVQFLVTLFILFYLLLDRAWFLTALRDCLPLARDEADQLTASVADSVHANLYATLVTSLIDSVSGGLMFWLLGLPAPILWTTVMFILSLLPIVGAGMVWVPAVAYLALTGQYLSAAALLAWGITTFLVVDNFLFVKLAGKTMRLHPVPAMIAFLGGIAIFGVSGIILGPAILAVTVEALALWRRRLRYQ